MTDLDLSPRSEGDGRKGGRSPRNWLIVGGLVAVLGFVLFQALTSATVYYRNVDEAVADRSELGDSTFRMQGTVVTEPTTDETGALIFEVSFNDVDAEVRHIGEEPTDLFELGIPVVAEGRWTGDVFESQQLVVKHSETYTADNPERVDSDAP